MLGFEFCWNILDISSKHLNYFQKAGQFFIWEWCHLVEEFETFISFFHIRNDVYTLFLVHNTTKQVFEGKCIPLKNKGFFDRKVIFLPLPRYCATWLIRSYPYGDRILILCRRLLPTGMPYFGNQTYRSIQTTVIAVQLGPPEGVPFALGPA